MDPTDLNAAAAQATTTITPFVFQANCSSVVTEGSTVALTLRFCLGPYGLTQASGTMNLTYSNVAVTATTTGDISMFANNFTNTGGSYNYAMTGSFSSRNDTLVVTTASNLNATTTNGNSFQRTPSAMTLTFNKGTGCFVMNGSETIAVNGNTWNSQATNYTRCVGKCPSAGSFTIMVPGSGTVTATFDGTSNAQLSDSNGATGTQTVSCL
jgi:hypothetical protein